MSYLLIPISLEVGNVIIGIAALLAIVIPIYLSKRKDSKKHNAGISGFKALKALEGTHDIDAALRLAVQDNVADISQIIVVYGHNGGFDLKAASPLNLHWAFVQDETRLTRFGNVHRMDRSTRKVIYEAFTSSDSLAIAQAEHWEMGQFKEWMANHKVSGYLVFPIGMLKEMSSITQKEVDVIVSLWIEVKGGNQAIEVASENYTLKDSLRDVVAEIKSLYSKHRPSDFIRYI